LGTKRYYSLNETGGLVWTMLEEGATVERIVECLVERYEVTREQAVRAVDRLVAALLERQLVKA